MNDRDKLITALEDAITELKVRRDDPSTPQEERAAIDAQLANLEAQLAQIRAQDLADAAAGTALEPPDAATSAKMSDLVSKLDDAVATNKQTSALFALASAAIGVLTA